MAWRRAGGQCASPLPRPGAGTSRGMYRGASFAHHNPACLNTLTQQDAGELRATGLGTMEFHFAWQTHAPQGSTRLCWFIARASLAHCGGVGALHMAAGVPSRRLEEHGLSGEADSTLRAHINEWWTNHRKQARTYQKVRGNYRHSRTVFPTPPTTVARALCAKPYDFHDVYYSIPAMPCRISHIRVSR